jgi:hypothetical protein
LEHLLGGSLHWTVAEWQEVESVKPSLQNEANANNVFTVTKLAMWSTLIEIVIFWIFLHTSKTLCEKS